MDTSEDKAGDDVDEEAGASTSAPLRRLGGGLRGLGSFSTQRRHVDFNKYNHLHPYSSVLTLSNLEDVVALENSAFPENERCSREKFMYRLTKCPELSFGLFSKDVIPDESTKHKSAHLKNPPSRKVILVAHVVATRTAAPSVTDASMAIPPNWETPSKSPSTVDGEPQGHMDKGSTIAVHSLAVNPDYQKLGLGSVLMKAYIERIKSSKIADRIALLAHGPLLGFYEGLGFQNMGESSATFGGGNWYNMVSTVEMREIPPQATIC